MSAPEVAAVIMIGPAGKSVGEQLLARAIRAAAADLIATLSARGVAPIIVAGPEPPVVDEETLYLYDPDRGAFHFGERLAELVERYRLRAVMYFGAASAPLLPGEIVEQVRTTLVEAQSAGARMALTNNLHSSDWVAFTVDEGTVSLLRQVNRDNSLAWVLQAEGNYRVICPLAAHPEWAFDLDTPTDLALVREHHLCPSRLRLVCQDDLLDRIPVHRLVNILAQDGSRAVLIGRVAPLAWHTLSQAGQCWIRVFSEERGMVASERLARGEVQSLVARLIDMIGPREFFAELAQLADAAIFDSRVVMAALGHYPNAGQRFASDLFLPEAICDEWLREFTDAACHAPIPILLGGHSVVAGGLYVLAGLVSRRRAGDV